MTVPLVALHGHLGSALRHRPTRRFVWGTTRNIVLDRRPDPDLDLPIDRPPPDQPLDGTEAIGPVMEFPLVPGRCIGYDVYGPFVRDLQARGRRFGSLREPGPPADAYFFTYDWRRDLVEPAAALARAVERVREAHGADRVDLVGHSTGGLVIRYFVRYGGRDVISGDDPVPEPTWEGREVTRHAILSGTANAGATDTFWGYVDGYDFVAVGRTFDPYTISTLPSIYTNVPWRGDVFCDEEDRPVVLDLDDPEVWRERGWGFHSPAARERMEWVAERDGRDLADLLARAERFLEASLARNARFKEAIGRPADDAYVIHGSRDLATAARARLVNGRTLFSRDEGHPLTGPGDDNTTVESLLARHGGSLDPDAPGPFRIRKAVWGTYRHRHLLHDPVLLDDLIATVGTGSPPS